MYTPSPRSDASSSPPPPRRCSLAPPGGWASGISSGSRVVYGPILSHTRRGVLASVPPRGHLSRVLKPGSELPSPPRSSASFANAVAAQAWLAPDVNCGGRVSLIGSIRSWKSRASAAARATRRRRRRRVRPRAPSARPAARAHCRGGRARRGRVRRPGARCAVAWWCPLGGVSGVDHSAVGRQQPAHPRTSVSHGDAFFATWRAKARARQVAGVPSRASAAGSGEGGTGDSA